MAFYPPGGGTIDILDEGITVVSAAREIDFTGAGVTATDQGSSVAEAAIPGGASLSIGSAVTSGTEGSVLFVGSGSVLAQDNANFFWNNTNKFLQITGTYEGVQQATFVLTGSIDPTASTSVTGVGTAFTTELKIGDRITVSGLTRTVVEIASDTSLKVDWAFTNVANDTSVDVARPLFRFPRTSSGTSGIGMFVDARGVLHNWINEPTDTVGGNDTEVMRLGNLGTTSTMYGGQQNDARFKIMGSNNRGLRIENWDGATLAAQFDISLSGYNFKTGSSSTSKMIISSTAGSGVSITAGTATTDVNALSVTQTWNNAAVAFKGVNIVMTRTANASASKALSVTIGANELFYVSSTSGGSYEVSMTDGGSAGLVVNSSGIALNINNASLVNIHTGAAKGTSGTKIASGYLSIRKDGAAATTGYVEMAQDTITTDVKLLDTSVTWNNAAVAFTAWKLNVTDTTSNAASRLMDLQVGSASKFNVSKAGVLTLPGTAEITTATTSLLLRQTGDSFGETSLSLQNRTGSAGALFTNVGLDLIDFGFKPNTSSQSNIRLEGRSGSKVSSLNTTGGEFQILMNATAGSTTSFVTGIGATIVNAGAFAVGTTTVTGNKVTIAGAATDIRALSITTTWNSAPTTYTMVQANATDTASAAGSLLMDLQVGAASKFKVDKFGNLTITQGIVASLTAPSAILVTGGAHTALTASTEYNNVYLNLVATVQFATGAITTQRAVRIAAPTYGFVGASTITNAATFYIDNAPIAGTNATITNSYAVFIDAGLSRFDGNGTNVFELPADATDPTAGGGAAAGRIPVLIGGVTKYIAYY